MKNSEVIERILQYHPHFEGYHGCDDYKCGNPQDECTGIVVALTPTIEVIRETARLGANLLIVHEPTFYTSADEDGWYESFENSVYQEKRKLLDDNGITVFRDHDHMHAHQPDSIFTGVLKYMGWSDKATVDTDTGLFAHFLIEDGPQSLRELCDKLINNIGLNGARIIGDPNMTVNKIALVGHLYPMDYHKKDGSSGEYSVSIIDVLEEGADVIIPGETIDWTVLSYIRDAVQLGRKKAMISIGHFNWEELGMKYYRDWLPEVIGHQVPVNYVPSRDMYDYVIKEGK